jgi:hypothetical protein
MTMPFTNQWTAPNGHTIVTGVIPFPDGTRSVAAIYERDVNLGPVGWQSVYLPAKPTAKTAAQLDQLLARGWTLFYLDGNIRSNVVGNTQKFQPGYWAGDPSVLHAGSAADFAWGMNRLASQVQSGAAASMNIPPPAAGAIVTPPSSGFVVQPGGGVPVAPPPPAAAPPPPSTFRRVGAPLLGVALVAGLAYLLLD